MNDKSSAEKTGPYGPDTPNYAVLNENHLRSQVAKLLRKKLDKVKGKSQPDEKAP
jgi:hypothetical protein